MSDRWFYFHKDISHGPVDFEVIEMMILNDDIGSENFVWKKSFKDWIKIKDVRELQALVHEKEREIKRDNTNHLSFTGNQMSESKYWYYFLNEKSHGPVDFKVIRNMILKDNLGSENFVWEKDLKDWMKIKDVRELQELVTEKEREIIHLGNANHLSSTGNQISESKYWYYFLNEKSRGPVAFEVIRKMILNEELKSENYVWKKGFDDWKKIKEIKELHVLLNIPKRNLIQDDDRDDIASIRYVDDSFDKWYFVKNDSSHGPVKLEVIKQMIFDEALKSDNFLWKKGFNGWKRIKDIEEFQNIVHYPKSDFFRRRHGNQKIILDNEKGISYEELFYPYLNGAYELTLTDPYISHKHQVKNLEDFLGTIAKNKKPYMKTKVHLRTLESGFFSHKQTEKFTKIKKTLLLDGIDFSWEFDAKKSIHDRSIVANNGMKISLGRGLDIFKRCEMRNSLSLDLKNQKLRRCKSTEITYLFLSLSNDLSDLAAI